MATTLVWPCTQASITAQGYIITIPGLIGYYTFDAADQTKDFSGNNNPISLIGTTSVTGYYGQAVSITSSSAYMEIQENA